MKTFLLYEKLVFGINVQIFSAISATFPAIISKEESYLRIMEKLFIRCFREFLRHYSCKLTIIVSLTGIKKQVF